MVVVAKTMLDEQRMQPMIQVAAGTDLAAIVTVASAVWGEW